MRAVRINGETSTLPELESLIEVFRDAREQLLNIITGDTGVGTKVYYNTILTQLETQLKRMEKQSLYYVQSEIPKEYRKILMSFIAIKRNNLQMKNLAFSLKFITMRFIQSQTKCSITLGRA